MRDPYHGAKLVDQLKSWAEAGWQGRIPIRRISCIDYIHAGRHLTMLRVVSRQNMTTSRSSLIEGEFRSWASFFQSYCKYFVLLVVVITTSRIHVCVMCFDICQQSIH
jgi:hypothetical protein